jgi:hypothetical protein
MSRDGLARFRRHPGPIPEGWPATQPSRIRHSDDQTVAALGAVYAALEPVGRQEPGQYRDWGVVAAPRFLGRGQLVNVIARFVAEGAWGVTPHMVPHYALHAQSGTLSQVLGIHGPNLSVGGGMDAAVQGFVTALTWLTTGTIPGVWIVLSGWTPEYVPDDAGNAADDPECLAIALALVPSDPERGRLPCIQLRPASPLHPPGEVDLVALAGRLAANGGGAAVAGREAASPRVSRVKAGSATYRLDPGHGAGGNPVVVARGCGVQVELEPAASSGMRRLG